ncbi:MAG: hypothetical protein B7Z20_05425 [Sphingobium sp. 32-64-5]|nr:MAG: hypothetical protein B7Z20_05425 [Sphingobium sp. 32-64-5]
MSDVKIGYGAGLWVANNLGVLKEIAEVTAIGLPNPQQDDVDATHFKSPNRQREFVPGLIDNGEIQFGTNYIAGSESDQLLTEAMQSGQNRTVVVAIPAGASFQYFQFSGIIKGYEKEIPIEDRQTATVTVRVSGAVTQSAVNPVTP